MGYYYDRLDWQATTDHPSTADFPQDYDIKGTCTLKLNEYTEKTNNALPLRKALNAKLSYK
ncbi:MAG: hypothetical protein J1E57_03755 [Prevotella sp.]|nr:hypothetical protein [Prevotella sp.]